MMGNIFITNKSTLCTLLKNCSYSEFFWSTFSRIRTKYQDLQSKYQYSIRMRKNADQKTPNTDTFYALWI